MVEESSSTAVDTSSSTGDAPQADPECADPIAWIQPGPAALESGFVECSDGFVHRVAAIACDPGGWTAGDCVNNWGAESECLTDAECGEGRCLESKEPWNGCTCNAGCTEDAECGASEACFCDGPKSRCIEASCRSDADCPAEEQCVLTQSVGACGTITRSLACTSPDDECRADGECEDSCAQCLVGFEQSHRTCSYETGICTPCG
jgi:hypothetical protein